MLTQFTQPTILKKFGYFREDFLDVFRRYVSKSELEALKADRQPTAPPPEKNAEPPPNGSP